MALYGSEWLRATTQTDAKGAFRFRHVASSRYRIVAKYEGFCPAVQPAAIDTCSYVE